MFVRVLQISRIKRMCIYTEKFKELAHVIVEACQVQNLRFREEWQFESKDSLLAKLLCLQGRSVLVLLRPLTDCMGLSHIMESDLLYSNSTDLNVNLSQKKKKKKNLHRNI